MRVADILADDIKLHRSRTRTLDLRYGGKKRMNTLAEFESADKQNTLSSVRPG